MRAKQIDQSSSLLTPARGALQHRRGFPLSLRRHKVPPLEPHLAQEEVGAASSHQEAQAEGQPGAGDLHGDTHSSTATSLLQHVWEHKQDHLNKKMGLSLLLVTYCLFQWPTDCAK